MPEAGTLAVATMVFHPRGSARARTGTDERAVLDLERRVRGVEGCRVENAGVFPPTFQGDIKPALPMAGEGCAESLRRAA